MAARDVCGSVKVGGENPENVLCIDMVKATFEGKEAAWKMVLGARDEIAQ